MLEAVEFRNFRVLQGTILPLGRLTLLVGANGSGKSTAMQALRAAAGPAGWRWDQIVTAGVQPVETAAVEVKLHWGESLQGVTTTVRWGPDNSHTVSHWDSNMGQLRGGPQVEAVKVALAGLRIYNLHPDAVASLAQLQPQMELREDGGQLVGVLDRLRDSDPERFDALNDELGRWLPEFDRILFDTPQAGGRSFLLRRRQGHHKIPANHLSHGTLLAFAMLTLAYLPEPPSLVCLEEPDRGIHPRLLRHVQDALYRLSYPEACGETRPPVQVLATTHSPYFLDLFKEHPEEIVLAQKVGQVARFECLVDQPELADILGDASLGEVWYSGILGGIPVEP